MNLNELIEKRKNLLAEASKATTNDELDKIEVEMRKLNIQIEVSNLLRHGSTLSKAVAPERAA